MDVHTQITNALFEANDVLEAFMRNPENIKSIGTASALFSDTIRNGGKIIACGNGGSHCDAMHFAEELTGRYRNDRRALPAIAISDPSHLSCVGNDYGYDHVFARFIQGLGKKGDALLAISTSGNSANVVKAVESARDIGMKVVLLSGKNGGQLAGKGDVEIRVGHHGYADRIQEVHIKAIHIMIMLIEQEVA